MTEALNALAANIVSRRTGGVDSYVLFLGAGASISSGCSSMLALSEDLLRSHDPAQFNSWEADIAAAQKVDVKFGDLQRREINEKKISRFLEIWTTLDSETKYAFLRKHLADGKVPSQGYLDLASLVKSKFFTTILTTNLDPLLERALLQVGLLQPEDFIVVVNGKDSLSELTDQLETTRAPIKIVKLHGTLESPRSYAFTPEEIFSFEKSIRPSLSRILNQSLIVVGHSMQDRDINMLFEEDGKEIHYINPTAPKRGSDVDKILTVRGVGSSISGSEAAFDTFFKQLRVSVETLSSQKLSAASGTSIEVFLQSIGFESELKAPRSRYKNLQTLYVKPTEYDDILTKLETDHVVFIIGEPHMGKTYTALYILWEYYQQGYETIHIRHDKLINSLHRYNNNLRDFLLEIFSPKDQRPRVIHFDDPFGQTSERNQAFAKGLDTFLDMARSYEHLRVVVTSRLNIFNEALSEHPAYEELEELEKTLRVHTSYRREVLLDILHRYRGFYMPAWAQDERITAALDEKLPSMLPAPHNIEFFVRTSETLNSLDAVLSHVEESKKMISALASWMKFMLPHEQIFLMWVEIGSTAGILFPGSEASEIEIEKAYVKTLAHFFSEGHLPGIPTVPFSSARDKFETILIERRDENRSESLRLDFVHPSYHEAFWYAVNRKFSLAQWWELLSNNLDRILQDLTNRVDLVQLKMIERYGTVNRDLDQMLLLSAESNDPNEQLIALGHMLDRPERFATLSQFAACITSVVSQEDYVIRLGFLNLYDSRFSQLPLDVLRIGLPLIFDEHPEVRNKAESIIAGRIHELPESLRAQAALRQQHLLFDLIPAAVGPDTSQLSFIFDFTKRSSNKIQFLEKLAKLESSEIQLLASINSKQVREFIFWSFNEAWDLLSDEQRQAIIDKQDITYGENLSSRIEKFVNDHPLAFMHLVDDYTSLTALTKAQKLFSMIPLDEKFPSALSNLPVEDWPLLSPSDVRELSTVSLLGIDRIVTRRVLEEYQKLSPEYRDVYLEALYLPHSVPALIDCIRKSPDSSRHLYAELDDAVLLKLINAEGYVQYQVFSGLLVRFDRVSDETRRLLEEVIDNPPEWWVGGSVGQLSTNAHDGLLGKSIEDLPFQMTKSAQKKVTGAILAEICQSYLDKSLGLQPRYKPLLQQLVRDPEVLTYAEDWMDYSLIVLGISNEEYWLDIKEKMRKLQEDGIPNLTENA